MVVGEEMNEEKEDLITGSSGVGRDIGMKLANVTENVSLQEMLE